MHDEVRGRKDRRWRVVGTSLGLSDLGLALPSWLYFSTHLVMSLWSSIGSVCWTSFLVDIGPPWWGRTSFYIVA
jgi:hypothetical protein